MQKLKKILLEINTDIDFEVLDINLVNDGLIDSYDLMNIVIMLEKVYDIIIDIHNIIPENFINLVTIKELINRSGGICE